MPSGKTQPSMADPGQYRVFISYSHHDLPLVKQIVRVLEGNRIDVMWDEVFAYGHGFHDQIRTFIAHAHVFLPVLTRTASERNWVHQEIGYASALNVPVLPIAIGSLPGEMIDRLHAIRLATSGRTESAKRLSPRDLTRLRKALTAANIASLVERHADPRDALFTCAAVPDIRNVMLARHAKDILELGRFGLVRQKGGLSSFQIPTETVGHPIWTQRYGNVQRSEEHCRLQREERIALSKHASQKGCRLIVDPRLPFGPYGWGGRLVRLEALRQFLAGMPDTRCEVATHSVKDLGGSVTIVGNWFAAESVTPVMGKGYYQTIFTRHAPTVQQKIESFDDEFDELLRRENVSRHNSRRHAIKMLDSEISGLQMAIAQSTARNPRPRRSKI